MNLAASINSLSLETVAANLLFSFPPSYPNVVPELDITVEKGLGDAHKAEILKLAQSQVMWYILLLFPINVTMSE